MDVSVRHRLPSGLAVVDADVEAIGCELLGERGTSLGDNLPKPGLVGIGEVEDARDVLPRNDESMSLCHRVGITERDRGRVLGDDQRFLDGAEGAHDLCDFGTASQSV